MAGGRPVEHERLYDRLYEDLMAGSKPFVSITGGGGKTTLMIGLARFFKEKGLSVLVTTTTKVISPYLLDYGQDRVFHDEGVLGFVPSPGEVVFYAHISEDGNKWCSPGFDNLAALYNLYDVVLCEADGSKRLPLKVHTSRDPQIHPLTTVGIGVVGMWSLGEDVSKVVFGPCSLSGTVDAAFMDWYFKEPEGILKGLPVGRRAVVFNGCDLPLGKTPRTIACEAARAFDVPIYIASAKEGLLYGLF